MNELAYNATLGSLVAQNREDDAKNFMDAHPDIKPNNTVLNKIKSVMPRLLACSDDECGAEIGYNQALPEKILDEVRLAEIYLFKMKDAERRHIAFDLTISDMRNIMKRKTCFYTGVKFDANNRPSFERKDNRVGYTASNTVLVTELANRLKNELFENPQSQLRICKKQLMMMLNKLETAK